MKERPTKSELHSNRKLLSVGELSALLGLKPQTIYSKMAQKLFPIRHKKIGRLVRFDSRDVDKYINSLSSYR